MNVSWRASNPLPPTATVRGTRAVADKGLGLFGSGGGGWSPKPGVWSVMGIGVGLKCGGIN